MSVDLQGPRGHEQFAVNTTQFEEIIPSRDERSSRSQFTPEKEKMDKDGNVDGHSDKEREKERKKSPPQSNYSSDDYEDDFEDSEPGSPKKPQRANKADSRRNSSPRRSGKSQSPRNSSRSPEHSSAKPPSIISPRSEKKSNIGRTKRYKAYESPRSSSLATSRHPEKSWSKPKNKSANVKVSRLDQTVVDRVLSANRHKVQTLESRLSQLIKELTQEREENKTLREIHYRQEKELMKVTHEEAELPRLITKHATEVKSLKERLRRVQDTSNQKENTINEQDKEILKLKDRCKHYKDLCEMKNLTERAELQKKLTKTETNLENRESEISKLQRTINLKEKTHARHLKEQNDKLREAQARLKEMEVNYNNLHDRLKEKEKQLDYTNIYQRQIILKEKGKNNASPEAPPKLAALPAPKKTKPKPKKTGNNNKGNNKNTGYNTKDKTMNEKKEVEVNKKPDSFFLTAHSDTGSDKELDKSGEMADKDHGKKLSIGNGNDVSDMALSTLDGDTFFEDQLAKENERRKKEEFEKSLREEEERLKKENEESGRRRREEEEREERERAEREAKWREETERKAREDAERREASARRMREEEERKKAEAKEKETFLKEDNFFEDEESRRKKDLLLARLQAIDKENVGDDDPYQSDGKRVSSGKSGDELVKSRGSKNSGHESRRADENLHNGLPALANDTVVSPPVSVKSDPDGIAGIPRHKPALIGRGNLTKKSNPFSWLDGDKKPNSNNKVKRDDNFSFGGYSPSMSDSKKKSGDMNNDDIFDTGLSRRAPRGRRGLGDNGLDFGERRGSFDKPKTHSNLPFLADDFGSKKNTESPSDFSSQNEPLLPRRRRAQEKSGPSISSAFDDNLDDDIEELAL